MLLDLVLSPGGKTCSRLQDVEYRMRIFHQVTALNLMTLGDSHEYGPKETCSGAGRGGGGGGVVARPPLPATDL